MRIPVGALAWLAPDVRNPTFCAESRQRGDPRSPGDLLVGTEGGAGLMAVRCDLTSCRVTSIILDNGTSHGEGHIVVAMGASSAAFRPAPAAVRTSAPPIPAALVVGLVAAGLIVVVTVALAVTARRRRLVE
jgi:xanthine/uracil permease